MTDSVRDELESLIEEYRQAISWHEQAISNELNTMRRLLDCESRYVNIDSLSKSMKQITMHKEMIDTLRDKLAPIVGIHHRVFDYSA